MISLYITAKTKKYDKPFNKYEKRLSEVWEQVKKV